MGDVTFEPATPADQTAVLALLEGCGLPTADLTPQHLRHFWVCRTPGGLVGVAGLELREGVGLFRSLAVAPEWRRRRVAHQLWARIRSDARARGLRELYLLTTTAAPLFARWGFRSVDRQAAPEPIRATAEYTSLCASTAAVMVLDLLDPAVDAPAP